MKFIKSKEHPNTYIALNKSIVEKFTDPYIFGVKQQEIMRGFAVETLNFLHSKVKRHRMGDKFIVRILSGAKYYYYPEAWLEVFMEKPLTSDMRILSRTMFNEKDVTAVILRDLTSTPTKYPALVFVPDTIASGKTMETFLEHFHGKVRGEYELIIPTIGTYTGVERVRKWCEKHSVDLTVIAYGALLGLGPNRTDMTLGYPPNEIPENILKYSIKVNGEEITEKLCVIGDFTNSNEKIDHYLAERLIQLWEIGKESRDTRTRERCMELILRGAETLLSSRDRVNVEEILAEEYKRRLKLLGLEVDTDRIPLENVVKLNPID